MALYKIQSPYNAALQGMQGASQTASSMTQKQEVKEGKKTFGGAIGSMVQGGTLGLSAAELFSGGEATSAMWSGLKGVLGGAETGAAGAAGAATDLAATSAGIAGTGATSAAGAAGATSAAAGATSATGTMAGVAAAGAETGVGAAGAASAAGPIGWGLLGAGALLGLASYYL